ncbi:peroxiredoxin family protein [Halovivax gelatinilyticus]|uniref:peroxiredoxin family protein n=1 Tax=Halovivax gelatinilyticus TaxID=2961597 RepID=UPI0020CA84C8|nr:redoxin domain-containing protein [Halovivax gelatinilyticus]
MPEFDIVEFEPADSVDRGETAPDFTRPLVTAEQWADRSLSDLVGNGPTVLVFTTMAGAFVAEYTLTELRDREIGVETDPWADSPDGETVAAVSISSPYELSRFLDEKNLPYGVFSDPTNAVAETYGVVHDLDGMEGITEPRPAIYVLDDDGTVAYVWVATEWPDSPDYDAVADAIEAARSE